MQLAEELFRFSYLKSANAEYIDQMLEQYQRDPSSVDDSWRFFFEGMELGAELAPPAVATPGAGNGKAPTNNVVALPTAAASGDLLSEAKVYELIAAYRLRAHSHAKVNPLEDPTPAGDLDPARFGLSGADLDRGFAIGKLVGLPGAPLRQIVQRLRDAYLGPIGAELQHVAARAEREWLQARLEEAAGRFAPDAETRRRVLTRLTEAEGLERFLHTRYVAQKRFSVEGGDAIVPALDAVIQAAAEGGCREVVLGMAHRGRLNVMVNLLGKSPEQLFAEFEGNYDVGRLQGEGDVKYHMGSSRDLEAAPGKTVHLSLAFNPSHLEFVGAVVTGMARARQLGATAGGAGRSDVAEKAAVAPVLIHGDAALAGQGVCYETLNLAALDGYGTGGTIHVVINNQVGFTTSPRDGRSSQYCTDLAKTIDAPVLHVNGDDADAVWWASRLAAEYRQKFARDLFIDLVCYRKHGHNEGDEPAFTQPLLYARIKGHASPREVYAERLAREGVVSAEQAQALVAAHVERLAQAQAKAKAEGATPRISAFEARWKDLRPAGGAEATVDTAVAEMLQPAPTGVALEDLRTIARRINTLPTAFHLHPKLGRFFEARLKAVEDGQGLDWGNAEALAYASLVAQGYSVRLSGQDVERGTFTHRHAILNDTETGERFNPFEALSKEGSRFRAHNSHLSETGVLGFEYGYSITDPRTLVIWEAQFGDFANGAQVIIDQFISSGEVKWQRACGLVLLLPHGYEGQGPEHSSARYERFLQLSGGGNLQVCNLTTPAQVFHAMRRQLLRPFRKPLVIMSPKSGLRHPQAISRLEDLGPGTGFAEILDDVTAPKAKQLLLCSGKIYYDLVTARAERKLEADVAIVRIEQLAPFPAPQLAALLAKRTSVSSVKWVQDEPRNMGGWGHVFGWWNGALDGFGGTELRARTVKLPLGYAGRPAAASPAVGSPKVHAKQQAAILAAAFSGSSE